MEEPDNKTTASTSKVEEADSKIDSAGDKKTDTASGEHSQSWTQRFGVRKTRAQHSITARRAMLTLAQQRRHTLREARINAILATYPDHRAREIVKKAKMDADFAQKVEATTRELQYKMKCWAAESGPRTGGASEEPRAWDRESEETWSTAGESDGTVGEEESRGWDGDAGSAWSSDGDTEASDEWHVEDSEWQEDGTDVGEVYWSSESEVDSDTEDEEEEEVAIAEDGDGLDCDECSSAFKDDNQTEAQAERAVLQPDAQEAADILNTPRDSSAEQASYVDQDGKTQQNDTGYDSEDDIFLCLRPRPPQTIQPACDNASLPTPPPSPPGCFAPDPSDDTSLTRAEKRVTRLILDKEWETFTGKLHDGIMKSYRDREYKASLSKYHFQFRSPAARAMEEAVRARRLQAQKPHSTVHSVVVVAQQAPATTAPIEVETRSAPACTCIGDGGGRKPSCSLAVRYNVPPGGRDCWCGTPGCELRHSSLRKTLEVDDLV